MVSYEILNADFNFQTNYENGELLLTSHRMIWVGPSSQGLALPLQFVLVAELEAGGFMKSAKISLQLLPAPQGNRPMGPSTKSSTDVVKFSFRQGGESSIIKRLHDALGQRQWEVAVPPPSASRRPRTGQQQKPKVLRSGIAGIEKSMQQKAAKTDSEISKAFQDLDKLMDRAKPMVALAKSISGKIRDRQGGVSDDETVQFKSYLLSLGISDPVTRDTHGSGQSFYKELAKEVFKILEKPLQESGGMMTLTDAFCRVNRARGLELISPEDLLNACAALKSTHLPMELHTFDSGVTAIQLNTHSAQNSVSKTRDALADHSDSGLTAEELSRQAGISVVLAKERLLAAEKSGAACRDDSVEGLRFYTNRFLEKA